MADADVLPVEGSTVGFMSVEPYEVDARLMVDAPSLVDLAKRGGLAWEGIAPRHAARLRRIGVEPLDVSHIRVGAHRDLVWKVSSTVLSNHDQGVCRLRTCTRISDGELLAIARSIRAARLKIEGAVGCALSSFEPVAFGGPVSGSG